MNVLRITLNILLLIIALSSCAQSRPVIKNSYAYLLVTHAGMIQVDDNGNQRSSGVDSSHIIFIETPATAAPQWEVALLNNKTYSISASPVTTKTIQVGFSQTDEQPIILKPATGNKLWRINVGEFTKNAKIPDSITKQGSPNSIVLMGKMNNKSFTHIIPDRTILRPIQGE